MGTSGDLLVPPGRDPAGPGSGARGGPAAAALPFSSGGRVIRAGSWFQPGRPRAGGATVAAAVAETRRGSPARGRGEGAAPVRGAPERAQGCGGHSEGRGRGLALLPVVPQLFPVLSRRVDVAGALQPAGGRERRSAGHCTGTAAVAPVCGGVPVLPRGTRAVVPVSLQDLRVVVLLPARGERLNGARGQPCPSPWQPSTQFSPGQHPPPPTPIQPLLPEAPDPVNEQHDEDNEEEDDDGREANEPRLQHLGARACMARGQAREKTGMETASGELHPPGNGTPPTR